MKDYKKYKVWEKSHQLTLDVYNATHAFPKEELFNLVSQMKRAAASIPMNIAEGCGRSSDKDFARFLYIALGSANELEYQIILSTELNFINKETGQDLLSKVEEIKKMLTSFIQKLTKANS